MADLKFFGLPFSELSYDECIQRVRDARKLRRMRMPEKAKKEKAKKPTTTKAKKLKLQKTFDGLSQEQKIALLKAKLAERQGELNG